MNTDTYLESNPNSGIAKLVVQAQRDAALALQRYTPIADAVREQMIRMYEEMAGPRNAMQAAVESFQKQVLDVQRSLPKQNIIQEIAESFQEQAKLAVLDFPRLAFPVIEPPSILPELIVPAPIEVTEVLTEKSEAVVRLPNEARWESLHCRFKDSHTLTVIRHGNVIGHFDHAQLGFVRKNTKDGKPDKQWDFLQQLALISQQRWTQPTTITMAEALKTSGRACQKIKESAMHKLCEAFGLADNPFHPYDSRLGYRLKFKLEPEPLLRGDGEHKQPEW